MATTTFVDPSALRRSALPLPALDPDVGAVAARRRLDDPDGWAAGQLVPRPAAADATSGWWTVFLGNLDGLTTRQLPQVLEPGLTGGMRDGLTNSMAIALPATIIPIGIAAFAAYAFAWIDFRGREICSSPPWRCSRSRCRSPSSRSLQLYAGGAHLTIPWLDKTITVFPDLDLNGTTTAVWLSHTAFGLPFAIFLLHNYISSLPRDLFEAARDRRRRPLQDLLAPGTAALRAGDRGLRDLPVPVDVERLPRRRRDDRRQP